MTTSGDAANKIGTYLKALAAKDNGVPFYVAFPHSTIDWTLQSGADIPIEERSSGEVLTVSGRTKDGTVIPVEIAAPGSPARNDAFDVTPARLITGLITERGVAAASREGLLTLYPERAGRRSSKGRCAFSYAWPKRSVSAGNYCRNRSSLPETGLLADSIEK